VARENISFGAGRAPPPSPRLAPTPSLAARFPALEPPSSDDSLAMACLRASLRVSAAASRPVLGEGAEKVHRRPSRVTPRHRRASPSRGETVRANASGRRVADDDMSAHDLYALLDLDSTASVADIKRAYRERMMRCHPDVVLATTPPDASPAERSARESDAALTSQLLNRAWDTLRDPSRRSMYDAGRALFGADSRFGRDAFTGVPLSENARPDLPLALFVDEGLCVGCRLCAMAAPRTFEMRPDLNVARVHTQWGDAEDDLEVAVASCPKDCIHSVEKRQLATLEWIHASQPRRRVNTCSVESMSGRGRGLEESPFVAMERFERRRREMQRDRELERERLERRAAAERAAERVSRVVGWSARAWRAVRGGSAKGDDADATTRRFANNACPLPRTYVSRALLPERGEGYWRGSNGTEAKASAKEGS